jgi:hypothetical protein
MLNDKSRIVDGFSFIAQPSARSPEAGAFGWAFGVVDLILH